MKTKHLLKQIVCIIKTPLLLKQSYKNQKKANVNYFHSLIRVTLFCLLFNGISYSQTFIINPGFEDGTDTIANHWSLDAYGSGRIENYAASGNYSMTVWNWYSYVEGRCANGTINAPLDLLNLFSKAGTPLIHKAAFLEGFYQYDTSNTISQNDSAIVQVFLKKYNASTNIADTVAFGEVHLPGTDLTQNFTSFSVPIEDLMPGVDPDSIIVALTSSIGGDCGNTVSQNCLYFYVDDLSVGLPLGQKITLSEQMKFWPNPVNNQLNILLTQQNSGTLQIINQQGKIVLSENLQATNEINCTHLPKGVYVIKITQNGIVKSDKFIKN